jgi:hypothetical protein
MGHLKEALIKLKTTLQILDLYQNLELKEKTTIKINEIENKLIN